MSRHLLTALALAFAAGACGSEERIVSRVDSSPDQAGRPVEPPVGATAAAQPAPTLPETVAAKTGAPSSAVRRTAAQRATRIRAAADTLEYDRAIEYKPRPGTELPAAKP